MKEIWKDIKGYEGKYMVSTEGRVKSLNYKNSSGSNILKQGLDRYGYKQLTLYLNGIKKTFKIHRLVAETFLENPTNLPQINHKDENKQNNTVSNLEFCSASYNINYGTRNKKTSDKLKVIRKTTGVISGENNPMYGKHHTEETKRKLSEAHKGKYTGENNPMYGKHRSNEVKEKLRKANKGKKISEETKKKMSKANKGDKHPQAKKVICITTGEIFNYIKEATKKYNVDNSSITKCCKGYRKTSGKHPITGEKLEWSYYIE